jgi:hypothetical protein
MQQIFSRLSLLSIDCLEIWRPNRYASKKREGAGVVSHREELGRLAVRVRCDALACNFNVQVGK